MMMNFANYYPTPPQLSNSRSSSSSNFELQQQSVSRDFKTDSGRGTSALSVSSEKDDTVANESLNSSSSQSRNSSLGVGESRKEDVEELKMSIAAVLKIVTEQKSVVSNLDSQMQQILSFQDRFLAHILSKSSGVSRATQTDSSTISTPDMEAAKMVFQRTKSSGNLPTTTINTPSPNKGTESKADGSSSREDVRSRNNNAASSSSTSTNIRRDTPPKSGRESSRAPPPSSSVGGEKSAEDLSAFLKNIHVGNGHDPSLYSIKSIDVPEYQNDTFQNDR